MTIHIWLRSILVCLESPWSDLRALSFNRTGGGRGTAAGETDNKALQAKFGIWLGSGNSQKVGNDVWDEVNMEGLQRK